MVDDPWVDQVRALLGKAKPRNAPISTVQLRGRVAANDDADDDQLNRLSPYARLRMISDVIVLQADYRADAYVASWVKACKARSIAGLEDDDLVDLFIELSRTGEASFGTY